MAHVPLERAMARHPELRWRSIEATDIPAWCALVERIEAVEEPAEQTTAEDLRKLLLAGSWKRPERDSLIAVDGGGNARAFGHVLLRPGDSRRLRVFCWGGVDPAWRRRGIGTGVLGWQELVARDLVEQDSRRAPATLRVHGEGTNVPLRHLALSAGFRHGRTYLLMGRRLADAPLGREPDGGVRLVPYGPQWQERVRLVHNQAFAEHWGSQPRSREDWARRTVEEDRFRPAWSILALQDHQVVGYAMSSQRLVAAGAAPTATIDLLGVLQPSRGQGIAGALLRQVLAAMRTDGVARVELEVDADNATGAVGLYENLGFVEQRREHAYVKEL